MPELDQSWATFAQLLSAVATVALLAIWGIYIRLFYEQYRERNRPWFLLHQVSGADLESPCLLVNMGAQTTHISAVLAVVHWGDHSIARRLPSDGWVPSDAGQPAGRTHAFREGPLASGDVLSLGTFGELFGHMVEQHGQRPDHPYEDIEAVELRVITASHANEQGLLGAYQRYRFERDGDALLVRPVQLGTNQMRSRDQRREVARWQDDVWRHSNHPDAVWTLE